MSDKKDRWKPDSDILTDKELAVLGSLLSNDIKKRQRHLAKSTFVPEEGQLNVQVLHIEQRQALLEKLKKLRGQQEEGPLA